MEKALKKEENEGAGGALSFSFLTINTGALVSWFPPRPPLSFLSRGGRGPKFAAATVPFLPSHPPLWMVGPKTSIYVRKRREGEAKKGFAPNADTGPREEAEEEAKPMAFRVPLAPALATNAPFRRRKAAVVAALSKDHLKYGTRGGSSRTEKTWDS